MERGEKEGLPPLEWRSGYAPASIDTMTNDYCRPNCLAEEE